MWAACCGVRTHTRDVYTGARAVWLWHVYTAPSEPSAVPELARRLSFVYNRNHEDKARPQGPASSFSVHLSPLFFRYAPSRTGSPPPCLPFPRHPSWLEIIVYPLCIVPVCQSCHPLPLHGAPLRHRHLSSNRAPRPEYRRCESRQQASTPTIRIIPHPRAGKCECKAITHEGTLP
jgi:hypothetical protein